MNMMFAQASQASVELGLFSVILQGGAFGLLAYIIVWMYPKETAMARTEREFRDKQFMSIVDNLQVQFSVRNQAIVQAVERQTQSLVEEMEGQMTEFRNSVQNICKSKSGT